MLCICSLNKSCIWQLADAYHKHDLALDFSNYNIAMTTQIIIYSLYTYFFYKKPVKGHSTESFLIYCDISTESFLIYCDISTESFLFGFLIFYIGKRITLKAVLTSFIKHRLLTFFRVHRGLLMGRIKKKQEKEIVTRVACINI